MLQKLNTMRPKEILSYYNKKYPNAWKYIDGFRNDKGKGLPDWADWCFVPLAGAYSIVMENVDEEEILQNVNDITLTLFKDIAAIGALAGWRVTQSVYRFDPDIYEEIINTPINGNIPHEVLFNLPEWCLYIETPNMVFLDRNILGFFVHLEYDVNKNRNELRLLLDVSSEDNFPELLSVIIHLGDFSLKESINKVFEEIKPVIKKIESEDLEILEQTETLSMLASSLEPFISLVLYICSLNSDIGDVNNKPYKPKPVKTKKGLRYFPPEKISLWEVGIRVGSALRKGKSEKQYSNTTFTGKGARKKPHIRRGHWHSFWLGPRDGERKLILKWIPPILVNVKDIEDLPVTIRPVK